MVLIHILDADPDNPARPLHMAELMPGGLYIPSGRARRAHLRSDLFSSLHPTTLARRRIRSTVPITSGRHIRMRDEFDFFIC